MLQDYYIGEDLLLKKKPTCRKFAPFLVKNIIVTEDSNKSSKDILNISNFIKAK